MVDHIISGSGGCFHKDTLLLVEEGTKRISEIEVGEKVWSFNEEGTLELNKVLQLIVHNEEEVYCYKYWGGELKATKNHWVLNQYNAFVEIGTLTKEDCLIDGMNHLRPIISSSYLGKETVYNLSVENNHTFIADSIRVHNGGKGNFNLIYGSGGGGKGGGGAARVAKEDPDTLRATQNARIVDLVCEGPIEGLLDGAKSIYLDNTPLQNSDGSYNFDGFRYDTRAGTNNQTYMRGFSSVEASTSVATEIRYDTAVVRQVSSDPNIDAVRITLNTPRLTKQDKEDGDLHGTKVNYEIALQSNGGGFVTKIARSFSGKTTTNYSRDHYITLTGSPPWDIRVSRTTIDRWEDTARSHIADVIYFNSYTLITNEKFSYPNSALIGMEIDASQFQRIPTRGYECKLLKVMVPNNYNPLTKTYSGLWDGDSWKLAWTDNPAWCFYDLLTNDRYGLGEFLKDGDDPSGLSYLADKWSMYEISQYCDELIDHGFGSQDFGWGPGLEPRFTCNLYLQTREEAYRVLTNFASIFRALIYWSNNQIFLVQDAPSDTIAQFNNTDVVNGLFSYQGSSSRVRHTVALVSWNDPERDYTQVIEYVEDEEGVLRYGYNETEIVAFGCTSRGQAHRVGKWLLFTENTETEVVTFSTSFDASNLAPGAIIETRDRYRAGIRYGGRLRQGSTENELVLDAPVDLVGGSFTITVTMPDMSIETVSITNTGTEQSIITLSTPLSVAPKINALWGITSSQVYPEKWRVVSITEEESYRYVVNAIEHNVSKYNAIEQDLELQELPTSIFNKVVGVVDTGSIIHEETLYKISEGSFGTKISVSWDDVPGAIKYRVSYRRLTEDLVNDQYEADNPIEVQTNVSNVEFLNLKYGAYRLSFIAYNSLGVSSGQVSAVISVTGETAPPDDVTNLSIEQRNGIIYLSWDHIDYTNNIDFRHYIIKRGNDWDTGSIVGYTTLNEITDVPTNLVNGFTDYMIKAQDFLGIESNIENLSTIEILPPIMETSSYSFITGSGSIRLSWEATENFFPIEKYEIRKSTDGSWANYTDSFFTRGSSYEVTASDGDNYLVSAIDTAGNYSQNYTSSIVEVALPTIDFFFGEISNGSITLSWAATSGGPAIQRYIVKYGEVNWDASTPISGTNGYIEGTSITIPINDWLQRTFRIKVEDHHSQTSDEITYYADLSAPTMDIVNYSHTFKDNKVIFEWKATQGTLPIKAYEVRTDGTDWDSAIFLRNVEGVTYVEDVIWTSRIIRVKAIDTSGNYSSNYITFDISVDESDVENLNIEYSEGSAILSWDLVPGSLSTKYYKVDYEATHTLVALTEANSVVVPVTWENRTFHVSAINANNTQGAEQAILSTIELPATPIIEPYKLSGTTISFGWEVAKGTLPIAYYTIREGDSWGSYSNEWNTTSSIFTTIVDNINWTPGIPKTYHIKAVDTAGNQSSIEDSISITIEAPHTVSVDNVFDKKSVIVSWNATEGSLPISEYIISYEDENQVLYNVGRYNTTSLSNIVEWPERTYIVKAVDIAGFESLESSRQIVISPPTITSTRADVVDNNVLLYWTVSPGSLPSESINLKSGGINIGNKSGTFTVLFESLGGTYTYTLTPIDTAGNSGTPIDLSVLVNQPPDYVLKADFYSEFDGEKDNAFILGRNFWQSGFQPSEVEEFVVVDGTISITNYQQDYVDAGDQPENSTGIDQNSQSALVVNSATIEGIEYDMNVEYPTADMFKGQTIKVSVWAKAPPINPSSNFRIKIVTDVGDSGWQAFPAPSDWEKVSFEYDVPNNATTMLLRIIGDSTKSGNGILLDQMVITTDLSNGMFEYNPAGIVIPVNDRELFEGHFTNNSYDQFQDFINGGYTVYMQPANSAGSYEEIYDYGVTLQSTKVTIVPTFDELDGAVTLTPTISVSNDLVNWTTYNDVWQVLSTNFRYIKFRIDCTTVDDKGMILIKDINLKLDIKLKADAGTGNISNATNGATISFNTSFIDIESITATALNTGGVPAIAVVDFVDVPHPTDFTVYLYNLSGNKITGDFTWSARGY